MKKKVLCMLMAITLALSMVGCGGTKSENVEESTETSAAETTENEPQDSSAAEESKTEESESTEESEEAETQSFEGTTIETGYFSLVYSDDWVCDEENDVSELSSGSRAEVNVPDPEDEESSILRVNIGITQNTAPSFSKSLDGWGMDVKEAIEGNSNHPVRKIGGVDCWVFEGGYGTDFYGYMPDDNAFIYVSVDDNEKWDLVDPLLDSVEFHVPAWTEDVIPWYWEGTPYSVSEHNTTVGSYTVNSKQIPLDVVNPCYEIFDARIQAVGNDYYIYDNNKLMKYIREGDSLKYDSDIELPFEAADINVGADGTIYISDFGDDFTKIQDGTEIVISTSTDHVALNPSCTWGVNYFTQPDVAKVNVADGAITNYTLPGLKSISRFFVTDNYIVLSGTRDDEDKKACLKVYDQDFNELMTLDGTTTTTGHYGSVSAVTETGNGLVVFDGNMRDVYFIDKNMSLIAAIDMTTLMGTSYPWPCQAITLENGSVIVICTDDRADESCDEAVVFQLTGF